ncbi:MAG TPA: DUF3014 domain-containing protein [Steroidobacteraceae bacterium]|jgi:hypothetical protein|nr:DUF3014 domain-containing protein [Steroidobacteraceae bacterium]
MVNKPVIGVAAAVVVVAAGVWYYLHTRHAPLPRAPVTVQQPAPAEPAAEAGIQHPLPAGQDESASKVPLPALADSDPALSDALARVAGAEAVKNYLLQEGIVRHLVVTIDNLPRQKVAVAKRPTSPVAGSFIAEGDELHATLDPQNFARYQPMMAVVSKLDMQQVAAVYVRFYPLFQSAYQDLGYPNGYFNDRLVQVIDSLLATPQPSGPVELVRPNVMYMFADPTLESRPAGQKLLIRMGPDNAAAIKLKLKELRAAITAAPPKR